jgi:UDP-4-amino-4,6-dideoxy-N-acetyl-beta-L-altrosamine transaminase
MKVYSYGKQNISQEDIDAVIDVLRSDFLTQGPKIEEFEAAVCKYTGAKYCVAISNGTAGLHTAMLALEITTGGEVITSPNTFAASANCVRYVDGTVKFADIDWKTANIDVKEVEKELSSKTKAIIPVHFAGQSCDMKAIHDLASKKGIAIVEDAAHAIGSDYKDTKVGSCKYSDMTVFSFHPVKNITTGEGGAITTNSKNLYEKLLLLRSHGINKSPQFREPNGRWYSEMQLLGFNYRMTDMQAALGISQLKRIESFKQRRRDIVSRYKELFAKDQRISFLEENDYSNACFHLCPILIDFENLKIDKKNFFDKLFNAGLHLQIHYIPVHLHPYYQEFGYYEGDYPVAEKYYAQTVSLPLYPDLTDDDIEYIVETFLEVLGNV